jgi:hypothetical protein
MKYNPVNGSIINTGAVYSNSGVALNAMIALNAMVELGGRDLKVGQKPTSALAFTNLPYSGYATINLPDSASILLSLPKNGKILRGYEQTYIGPTSTIGMPMGLLLCITYPNDL